MKYIAMQKVKIDIIDIYWNDLLKGVEKTKNKELVGNYIEGMLVMCNTIGEKLYNNNWVNNRFYIYIF